MAICGACGYALPLLHTVCREWRRHELFSMILSKLVHSVFVPTELMRCVHHVLPVNTTDWEKVAIMFNLSAAVSRAKTHGCWFAEFAVLCQAARQREGSACKIKFTKCVATRKDTGESACGLRSACRLTTCCGFRFRLCAGTRVAATLSRCVCSHQRRLGYIC